MAARAPAAKGPNVRTGHGTCAAGRTVQPTTSQAEQIGGKTRLDPDRGPGFGAMRAPKSPKFPLPWGKKARTFRSERPPAVRRKVTKMTPAIGAAPLAEKMPEPGAPSGLGAMRAPRFTKFTTCTTCTTCTENRRGSPFSRSARQAARAGSIRPVDLRSSSTRQAQDRHRISSSWRDSISLCLIRGGIGKWFVRYLFSMGVGSDGGPTCVSTGGSVAKGLMALAAADMQIPAVALDGGGNDHRCRRLCERTIRTGNPSLETTLRIQARLRISARFHKDGRAVRKRLPKRRELPFAPLGRLEPVETAIADSHCSALERGRASRQVARQLAHGQPGNVSRRRHGSAGGG